MMGIPPQLIQLASISNKEIQIDLLEPTGTTSPEVDGEPEADGDLATSTSLEPTIF